MKETNSFMYRCDSCGMVAFRKTQKTVERCAVCGSKHVEYYKHFIFEQETDVPDQQPELQETVTN
jgi:uncharacterized Zn finger protein (UPF0148 family)